MDWYHASMHTQIKLGLNHFSFLRSIADGLNSIESAKRYLCVDHGHEAITASRNTINAVRAIAKRNGEKSAWRLIGLTIKSKPVAMQISLEDYIERNDLFDWSESDVLEMYKEAFPTTQVSATRHRENLRIRQRELLDRIEKLSVQSPQDTDMVSGWFEDGLGKLFITAGIVTIGNLKEAVSRGGRWYSKLPSVGVGKAERIKSFLHSICPDIKPAPSFSLSVVSEITYSPTESSGASLNASSDHEAVESWIRARAGSKLTATTYKREAVRLMLWLNGKLFGSMKVEDCLDYMTFLQHIPAGWISKSHAKPFQSGWAPFRGQLSHDSQKQSIVIVAALFHFLHQASFISSNPWALVNQKTGDDSKKIVRESRAISEFGFKEIIRYIEGQPQSHQSERIRFIFMFLESVGLRSMEFLNARLEHFQMEVEGLVLYVNGKGNSNRLVFIPDQANAALQRYLSYRGLTIDSTSPLLASVVDSCEPLSYQAFYQHVKSWALRAIRESNLSTKEKGRLEQASPHWLRHTFGTRAVARNVPMDAIQAQMGHSSIKTTMDIYGKAPLKRRAEELSKAFK